MTPSQPNDCQRADASSERKSGGRIAVGVAVAVALVVMVVLGETWAIERAPTLPKAVIHVFTDGHSNSPVPIAVAR